MNYRMLAVDMDDTLLGKDLQISARTVECIRLAREVGVKVVISSGRMFRAIVPYMRQLELTDPAIVYNGAAVYRLDEAGPLINHIIPVEIARAIARRVEEMGSQLNAYINDQLYVRRITPEVGRYMKRTRVESTVVGPMGDFLQVGPTKLLVMHDNLREIAEIKANLLREFGDLVAITGSKPYFIEIMQKGISKGRALAELAASFDFAAAEVIAVGDGLNDMEMVQWAGLGVAVANAHPDLKAAANYITASCDEEGVAQVIREFILKPAGVV